MKGFAVRAGGHLSRLVPGVVIGVFVPFFVVGFRPASQATSGGQVAAASLEVIPTTPQQASHEARLRTSSQDQPSICCTCRSCGQRTPLGCSMFLCDADR